MSERWVIVTKPASVLEPLDPEPVARQDGATWQRFRTSTGKIFAQVVEPTGMTLWFQQVGA